MTGAVYDFKDYRKFLIEALGGESKRTGQRGALAEHLGCQSAYLSQVLKGVANFNLEQAFKVNQFFGHDETASEYFLNLVQLERAGTRELKQYFQGKLDRIHAKRTEIKARVKKTRDISDADHAHYYSQWYISAIHVALSITSLQTVNDLCTYFHLEEATVRETLEFLTSRELAKFANHKYSIGPSHVHLPRDSAYIRNLHTNWRLQAVASLDRRRADDLHYSVVYSLSREDAAKIRKMILDTIEKNMEVVKPSKEEVLYCNSIDFFELRSARK